MVTQTKQGITIEIPNMTLEEIALMQKALISMLRMAARGHDSEALTLPRSYSDDVNFTLELLEALLPTDKQLLELSANMTKDE